MPPSPEPGVSPDSSPDSSPDISPDVSPDVSIVTAAHDVADARLHRICAALVRGGGTVELLGVGQLADAPTGVAARVWPRPALWRRAVLVLRMALAARGRVLYAPDPDSLVAARLVGAARRRPVVADVHEDYRRLLLDRRWAAGMTGAAGRGVVAVAERLAATSALTLVADDHVPPQQARRRVVVRNVADPRLLGDPAEPEARPRAVYVGDVRRSRGLFAMLDALEAAPEWTLDVVGPVATADAEELETRLDASPRLAARIRWHGRLTPRRSWDIARGAWVGLALLEDTPAFRDAVPSKLHEYLQAGLVPVVTNLPRQAELARDAGGFVVESGGHAALVLQRLAADVTTFGDHRRRVLVHAAGAASGAEVYDLAADQILEVARG